MNKDISYLRENYTKGNLEKSFLNENPIIQFQIWLDQAIEEKILEPNAFCLSTVSEEGIPSSRILLLKEIYDGGFVFYTNYRSKKGEELITNSNCAMNFFWLEMQRQVRIGGVARKLSFDKSEAYFHTRPFESQVGAISSAQSSIISKRKELEVRYEKNFEKYENEGKVPMPDHWGGYQIMPNYFEFWQGRASRLHDRFEYMKEGANWKVNRLEP